jgi:anaerobic selenocysteine-containing dehydrogenase
MAKALEKIMPVIVTVPMSWRDFPPAPSAYHNGNRPMMNANEVMSFSGKGGELGEALFDAILKNRSGVVVSIDPYEETWRRIHGGRINLTIPELIPELKSLRDEHPSCDPEFPFVLSAGQRRSSTANTIIRDPQWRPKDPAGALWMNPADASGLGVQSGGRVRVITKRGSAETVVEVTDTMLPGHVALPNGTGLWYPDREGHNFSTGLRPTNLP